MKVLFLNARDITFDSRSKRNCELLSNIYEIKAHHIGSDFIINDSLTSKGSKNKFQFIIDVIKSSFNKDVKYIYAIGLPTLLLSLPAKILSGKRLIFDSRELYLLSSKKESTYTWKHRLLERLSTPFIHGIIAANELRMNAMKKEYTNIKRYSYLLNIPYKINIQHKPKIKNTKSTIVYQGHIGAKRGLDKLIKSSNLIKDKVKLIFIVPSDKHTELINIINQCSSDLEYEIHDFMKQDEMLEFISQYDIGFLSYELYGLNNIYCEPNKLYEYAQAKLMILSSPQEKFINCFKDFDIGIAIDSKAWNENDYNTISNNIITLIDKSYSNEEFQRFNLFFSSKKELERLENFMRTL